MIPENLTPAMKQWKKFKDEHKDKIVLFRMGDFYEIFGEDAKIAAPILDIVLTTRDRDSKEPIPMCGVPYHAVNVYLQKLLKAGLKVVIVEQVEDPKKAKGIVKREITRILTPGTVLEESLIEKDERVLIASFFEEGEEASIAFTDLSKGDLRIVSGNKRKVYDFMYSLNPREILIPEGKRGYFSEYYITPLSFTYYDLKRCCEKISRYFNIATSLPGIPPSDCVRRALGALLFYLEEQKAPGLDFPYFEDFEEKLMIDEATRKNLELVSNLEDGGKEGTLFKILDECLTPMGKRLLYETILFPKAKVEDVVRVQEEIKEWIKRKELLRKFRRVITNFGDWGRINARFDAKIASPKDALQLREILRKLKEALSVLEGIEGYVSERIKEIPNFEELYLYLNSAIDDNPPYDIKDGGVFKKGFNEKLDELRDLAENAHLKILKLEAKEREETQIQSLKIKYNKVFGYFIEVTKANLDKVPPHYERKQTLVNAERFITPEIKDLEMKILTAKEESLILEEDLWNQLLIKVKEYIKDLRKGAEILSYLDLYSTLAHITIERDYIIPEITEDLVIHIEDGRHPVLELDERHKPFVPNSIYLNDDDRQLIILTGPNMGGKSTYLRQIALLVIMAQIGMGIPAKRGKVGIVDKLFCRVGASDNLRRGLSTFMVEMSEASAILKNATKRSLVLLDEVGRGTSTYDGLSLAWAIGEALSKDGGIGCRTVFATHYHELTDLKNRLEGVFNLTMAVREYEGKVFFLRSVEEGAADRSYGIHVAELAGIPKKVIERAKEILNILEETKDRKLKDKNKFNQPSLFFNEEEKNYQNVVEKLKKISIENITPIEALNILYELKKEVEN